MNGPVVILIFFRLSSLFSQWLCRSLSTFVHNVFHRGVRSPAVREATCRELRNERSFQSTVSRMKQQKLRNPDRARQLKNPLRFRSRNSCSTVHSILPRLNLINSRSISRVLPGGSPSRNHSREDNDFTDEIEKAGGWNFSRTENEPHLGAEFSCSPSTVISQTVLVRWIACPLLFSWDFLFLFFL